MTPCPPDDVLGALVQQVLGDDESERVRLHIDECGSCAEAVIAAVRGRAMNTAVAPTLAMGTPSFVDVEASESVVAIGAKIGRYDVRSLLGAGGMGHVYEAYDAELDRAIALKVLRPDLALAQTLTDRLVRESRLMAKVSHPAVITVYDVGREGATVFIAMELIRGETLGSYVSRKRCSWRETVELFERAGAGLAAAHRAGIVHRDFKPDNALVEVQHDIATRVVVTDFGIARATSIRDGADPTGDDRDRVRKSDPRITSTGGAIGTPAYMAPEQLGGNPVDLRADVFAFAASLWEALFGSRPFPGGSVDEIRTSMKRPPQPPKSPVPRSVVRALERGLAIDPAERWQDMTAFVRELVILRSRRRRVQLAAGVVGLVGAGIAGALLLARPSHEDPCARATLAIDSAALRASISDHTERDAVTTKIEGAATAWRKTHAATCKPDRHPVQAPTTTACLDARKLEIAGIVDDLIADKGKYATSYIALLGDPAQCASPSPSQLIAKVPADPGLRRRVTAIRYRAFAAETARDQADFKRALAEAAQAATEAELTWPFVHAETLYLLGTAQSMGGDSKLAKQTLKHAAAVADAAHHDYIAANVWIQLVLSTSFDEDAPERGLEYATYAEAALERLGHPPVVTAMFEYAKGGTLIALARFAEAEKSLRHAVELAEHGAIETLPQAIQGLGFLYEQQGRYTDAVEAYRLALQKLPAEGQGSTSSAIIFRQRLAINLSMLGKTHEAEAIAREAVAIAEQYLPPENFERALARGNLAEVLLANEDLEEALVEVEISMRAVAKIEGERSGRYGELMQIEADILHNLERHDESAAHFARACDITAFHNGEKSADHAACELAQAMALNDAGKHARALAVVDHALPILVELYGEPHPQVANALLTRGQLRIEAGHEQSGIADLERGVANFEKVTADPGHLAGAQWALARALWKHDHARAKTLLEQALKTFETASLSWTAQHIEAEEWLTTDGKPKQPAKPKRR
jgi:eukaryotic-like serine/threonine-protein kinase